jgi:hypothetical protein
MLNKKIKKAMKNQSENLMAAFAAYVAPSVELIEVSVEKGFAQSDITGGSGEDTGVGYTEETWK